MFGTAVRALDTASLVAFSPSKTGRVRVTSTRYRRDPYKVKVVKSPAALPPPRSHSEMPYIAAAHAVTPEPVAVQPPHMYGGFSPAPTEFFPSSTTSSAASAFGAAAGPRYPTAAANDLFAGVSAHDTEDDEVPPCAAMLPFNPGFTSSSDSALSDASATTAKPSTSRMGSAATKWAMVRFKHESVLYNAPFRVAVGDHVVVEADRGEHVGVVKQITSERPSFSVPSRILRRATPADVAALETVRQREIKTTVAVQKLSESIGLGIKIVDTEFQVDCNKMTVFFASKCFVDFRKLQRCLFREYRCRIWLVNWAEVRHE